MSAVLQPSTQQPTVKGWCPGALRPMMSGDGLIVRIRPKLAHLTRTQAIGLCKVALAFGSGIIDLTSRANLQIRGIRQDRHQALLSDLAALNLLDADPAIEARRNVLCTPLWEEGDLSARLHEAVLATLPAMPALPAKMGIAIDTGIAPRVGQVSADFRFERSATDGLILRADGMPMGRAISEDQAIPALRELMAWFMDTGGPANKRMARHVLHTPVPAAWATHLPAAHGDPVCPGETPAGIAYGAAFGQMDAARLRALIEASGASALRVTPWRLFILEDASPCEPHGFLTQAGDRLLNVHACPGMPYCPSASVETRAVAKRLAQATTKTLHISGCSKGCAHPSAAALTLVGRDGAFDVVRDGAPWDAPNHTAITAADLPTFLPTLLPPFLHSSLDP